LNRRRRERGMMMIEKREAIKLPSQDHDEEEMTLVDNESNKFIRFLWVPFFDLFFRNFFPQVYLLENGNCFMIFNFFLL
jgi:hypothetical protein